MCIPASIGTNVANNPPSFTEESIEENILETLTNKTFTIN